MFLLPKLLTFDGHYIDIFLLHWSLYRGKYNYHTNHVDHEYPNGNRLFFDVLDKPKSYVPDWDHRGVLFAT